MKRGADDRAEIDPCLPGNSTNNRMCWNDSWMKERSTAEALAAEITRRDIQYVVIAARGTSDNAGRYAQYLLGAHNGCILALPRRACSRSTTRPPGLAMRWCSASARAVKALTLSQCWLKRGGRAHLLRQSRISQFRSGPDRRFRHRPACG